MLPLTWGNFVNVTSRFPHTTAHFLSLYFQSLKRIPILIMQLFMLGMSMYKSVYMYVCKFMTWNVDASVSKSERFCRLKFVCGLFDMRNKNNVSSFLHVGGDPKPRTRTNENSEFRKNERMRKGIIIRVVLILRACFLSEDEIKSVVCETLCLYNVPLYNFSWICVFSKCLKFPILEICT